MIRIASSLTNRIFLASTLLAILSLGFAFAFVNARASAEVEADLERGIAEAATLVDQNRAMRTDTFTTMAQSRRRCADAQGGRRDEGPADRPAPGSGDYLRIINADLLVITDPSGAVLGVAGTDATSLALPQAHRRTIVEEIIDVPAARPRRAAGGQRADPDRAAADPGASSGD